MARGRRPGFKMPEEHRAKISNSNILNALIEHVEGRREMSATQVSAGLGLLRKVMPDMSENKNDVNVEIRSVMRMPEPAKDAAEWIMTSSGSHKMDPKPH
jgi:hypothetical protein